MSPSARSRPRSSRLGLVLSLAWLAFGAWKLFAWYGRPDADKIAFRPLPYVMYGLKPNFTREGPPLATSNGQGFRGREIVVPKPEGLYRILCLGGSTTYSFRVGDDETYPLQLERQLQRLRPDLRIEVINAGVESYTSAESLTSLAFRCLDFEPDCVVVYDAQNDYRPRRYANFESGYAHYRRSWDGSLDRFEERDDEIGGINVFIQYPPPGDSWGDTAAHARAAGTEAFRRNLVSLVGLARAHGIRPVFLTAPTSRHHGQEELRAGIAEHNEVIRVVCRATGAHLVDFAPRMAAEAEHWIDVVHLSSSGCALQGRLVAESLAPHLP